MRSSTLSPKIQRYSMLPATCRSPPCRNIEVKTVTHENAAGTRPAVQRERVDRPPERQLVEEDEHVDRDQRDRDDRRGARRDDVAERNHGGARGFRGLWLRAKGTYTSNFPKPEAQSPKPGPHDLQTLRNRNRRQGADLLRCGNATTEPRIKPPSEGPLFERPRRSRLPVVIIVLIVLALLLLAWFELYR